MKHFTTLLCAAAMFVAAGCSESASDVDINTKTAVKTCGGADKVESVNEEGFTCKD